MGGFVSKFFNYLESWPTTFLVVFCTCVVLFVGLTDYVTGDEIDLTIFYFVPIAIVSWLGRPKLAYFFSTTSAIERVIADTLAGHIYAHSSIPIWNSLVYFITFFSVAVLVGKQRELLDSEKKYSRTDALTGLSNLRSFVEYSATTFERARRHPFDITAVYIDLDNFKWVNDNLGHSVGNEVLIATAYSLRNDIRSIDLVSRIGGDEFVILMPEVTHKQVIDTIERLRVGLTDEFEKRQWPVTVSIGVATFSKPPTSVDEMISKADELMYEAKRAGKNKVVTKLMD